MVALPSGIQGSAEFSEDHVPPRSVGGRSKVLACKKCNNDSGNCEAELLKLMDFGTVPDKRHQSILPKTKLSHKETGVAFPVSVRHAKGSVDIQFHPAAKKHDEKLKAFVEGIHAGQFKSLSIQVETPDEHKIAKALLKSVYLFGFVWWGYEFVYSNHGEWIRQVLRDERTYPTRVPTIWQEAKDSRLKEGVSILVKDNIKQAFIITVELKTASERMMAATLIPNPTSNGWSKLSELNAIVEGKIQTEVTGVDIPKITSRAGYTAAWNLI